MSDIIEFMGLAGKGCQILHAALDTATVAANQNRTKLDIVKAVVSVAFIGAQVADSSTNISEGSKHVAFTAVSASTDISRRVARAAANRGKWTLQNGAGMVAGIVAAGAWRSGEIIHANPEHSDDPGHSVVEMALKGAGMFAATAHLGATQLGLPELRKILAERKRLQNAEAARRQKELAARAALLAGEIEEAGKKEEATEIDSREIEEARKKDEATEIDQREVEEARKIDPREIAETSKIINAYSEYLKEEAELEAGFKKEFEAGFKKEFEAKFKKEFEGDFKKGFEAHFKNELEALFKKRFEARFKKELEVCKKKLLDKFPQIPSVLVEKMSAKIYKCAATKQIMRYVITPNSPPNSTIPGNKSRYFDKDRVLAMINQGIRPENWPFWPIDQGRAPFKVDQTALNIQEGIDEQLFDSIKAYHDECDAIDKTIKSREG